MPSTVLDKNGTMTFSYIFHILKNHKGQRGKPDMMLADIEYITNTIHNQGTILNVCYILLVSHLP